MRYKTGLSQEQVPWSDAFLPALCVLLTPWESTSAHRCPVAITAEKASLPPLSRPPEHSNRNLGLSQAAFQRFPFPHLQFYSSVVLLPSLD